MLLSVDSRDAVCPVCLCTGFCIETHIADVSPVLVRSRSSDSRGMTDNLS